MNKSSYSFFKSCIALAVLLFGWGTANAQCATTTVPTYTVQCNNSSSVYISSFSTTGGSTNITNNGTGCGNTSTSYSAYPNMKVVANAGANISVTTTTPNTSNLTKVAVYVDFNQNGIYESGAPEETIYTQVFYLGTTTQTMTVAVPVQAKNGLTKMRVRALASNTGGLPTTGPCNTVSYGETEDYGFEVVNPCLPPDVVSVANVDYKSAELSWSAKGNARLYEYVYSADPNFNPTSVGYYYTDQRFLRLNTLICDTTYTFYVRCVCDTSGPALFWDTSSWKKITFKTDPCCYDPQPTMSNITSTSAIGRWDPVGSAYGYEYAVSVQKDPPQNGTYTTYTSAFLQGLMSSQLYYLHVRSRCSPTPLSNWKSIPFATSRTLDVNAVNGSNVFEMNAYPNPVSDKVSVTVEGTRTGDAKLYLTDMTGKVMKILAVTSEVTDVEMSAYPAGIYIIKYIDDIHNQVLKVNKQ